MECIGNECEGVDGISSDEFDEEEDRVDGEEDENSGRFRECHGGEACEDEEVFPRCLHAHRKQYKTMVVCRLSANPADGVGTASVSCAV